MSEGTSFDRKVASVQTYRKRVLEILDNEERIYATPGPVSISIPSARNKKAACAAAIRNVRRQVEEL